jgi:hypothetical protein
MQRRSFPIRAAQKRTEVISLARRGRTSRPSRLVRCLPHRPWLPALVPVEADDSQRVPRDDRAPGRHLGEVPLPARRQPALRCTARCSSGVVAAHGSVRARPGERWGTRSSGAGRPQRRH